MNCLEFRRIHLIAPRQLPPAAREHAERCAVCADYAGGADAFEAELERAFNVPIESSLASRVLLKQEIGRVRSRRRILATAAVVAGAGVASVVGYRLLAPERELFDASIRHVQGETGALRAQQRVTSAQLRDALAISGARLVSEPDSKVTYLHDCPVPGGLGKHLVLRTPHGTVTLITMPKQKLAWRTVQHGGVYSVALLPCKYGSVAILAASREVLAAAESLLAQHIHWRG